MLARRIPITIVTGFLGTGKTTLLRHLLSKGQQRLAVIVNEFGSVGLDGDLIRSCGFCPDEEIEGRLVELNNGCLCCTVQDDFLPTMEKLLARSEDLDGIIIETSGLALPRPLLQALDWPAIRTRVSVNGVVTVTDGQSLLAGSPVGDLLALQRQRENDPNLDHLTSIDELFTDQLQAADIVLISRSDLLSKNEIDTVKKDLFCKTRKGTPLIQIANGEIEPRVILDLSHHSEQINEAESVESHNHHSHNDHHHVEMFTTTIRLEVKVEKDRLEKILSELAYHHQVFRLKGRVWFVDKALPLQVQMVGPRISTWYESAPEESWKPHANGLEFVFIGFNQDSIDKFPKDLEKFLRN